MNTVFYATKGGQGTTVTAAAFALNIAANGTNVLLVDYRGGDAAAALGLPTSSEDGTVTDVVPNLRLLTSPPSTIRRDTIQLPYAEVYVFDADEADVVDIETRWGATPVAVVRNCYLALRKVIAGHKPERVVLVSEPGRSLRGSDVEAIMGVPVTVIKLDPAVARSVDAGLLASRVPAGLAAV